MMSFEKRGTDEKLLLVWPFIQRRRRRRTLIASERLEMGERWRARSRWTFTRISRVVTLPFAWECLKPPPSRLQTTRAVNVESQQAHFRLSKCKYSGDDYLRCLLHHVLILPRPALIKCVRTEMPEQGIHWTILVSPSTAQSSHRA
jgi:hypothetical protein